MYKSRFPKQILTGMSKHLLFGNLSLAVIFISSMILFEACDTQRPAIGHEDKIYIIADTTEYYELEPILTEVFTKIIYTPQPENLFNIERKTLEELDGVKNRKNLIIISALNSGNEVTDFIKERLDSNVAQMVEGGKEFVFNKYDLWAADQLVMFLTAPNVEELSKKILLNKDNLIHYFKSISNKRLYRSLYNPSYERTKIEAQLLKDYGWIIYVQADFQLAKSVPEDNFVWLRRAINTDMERWIFVHWIENASPELLNSDSIYAMRNKITTKHYQTVNPDVHVIIADDQPPAYSEVNFQDKYAIMSQGFWRFNDKSGGGPFISYTFFDEKTQRIYMLDGSIYAPKYYKKKLIQQVDVILQSWKPAYELPEEKKEDLLDELN